MSSQSRRYLLARSGPGDFKPPNIPALGAVPFGVPERARLASWLGDAGWPRGHMEMAELEGYLVALISWPVSVSPGAWLPPIWGVRGWKVPAPITSDRQYDEFVGLTVGFMQELDRDISREPMTFDASVLWALQGRAQIEALHLWGRGFMTALTLGSQGFKWRSPSSVAAVRIIASRTAASASLHLDRSEILSAVSSLVMQRKSKGPLGPCMTVALDPPPGAGAVTIATPPRTRSKRKDEA